MRVVAKAEVTQGDTNPHFVVTSLRPAEAEARHLYEKVYCARGDMENRIKECQADLFADRTSAATMRANQLRLWFAAMAYVLLCALRRIGLSTPVESKAEGAPTQGGRAHHPRPLEHHRPHPRRLLYPGMFKLLRRRRIRCRLIRNRSKVRMLCDDRRSLAFTNSRLAVSDQLALKRIGRLLSPPMKLVNA